MSARGDIGMDADENELVIFFEERRRRKNFHARKKIELARALLKIILEVRENCLTKKT